MRTRLAAVAAVGGLAVAVLPAHAATAKPQIVDAKGDANGINDQGFGAPVPSTATPADFGAGDIQSVLFKNNYVTKIVKRKAVKKFTGFSVTMTLGGAPSDPEVFYRVSVATAGCTDLFFEYGTDVATGGTAMRCPALPPAPEQSYKIAKAVIKGATITWTVPAGTLPAGSSFSTMNAQTRFNPALVTAPQIDYASSASTFTTG